jgi:Tol biopolymer transport system component
MPLPSGTALGSYEVQSLIGAGGMGEVYRARDTRLKRVVAIKVLPPAFASDPQRMARFQREAEVLASLNHPGIAAIYGLEERALVMELVDGPTLAGPLPLETALNYARQIAEALEYAHERGVMHRDLKPANIKVTPEGVVKLLDFGLAKAIEDPVPSGDPSESPTLTLGATRAGVILGTASYMSPEQAHGKAADRRADIFSFGAVLYEMLSGKRAFTGESVGDTLASVLKLDPDWNKLPTETPESIRRLLRRCLAKDRKQRLQAIGEARIVLENPGSEAEASPGLKPALPWSWIATTAIAAVVAGVALWGWLKPVPAEPRPVTRFTVQQGKSLSMPVLSRDGSRIAQGGGPQAGIFLRMMDEFEAKPIPGTDGASYCFSPDGLWIAFAAAGGTQLKTVPVAGGAALTVAEGLTAVNTCDWGQDDNIYFAVRAGIMRVPSSGGKPETIATPDAKKNEFGYSSPQLLPGGKQLLISVFSTQGPAAAAQVATLNLQTKEKKIVLESAGTARYAPSGPNPFIGHIVYGRNGSLFAVAFDVNRLQVGSPSPVLDGVLGIGGLVTFFGFSDSGTLAYLTGNIPVLTSNTLVWVDRQGVEQAIPAPARGYAGPKLSPDGGRVAFSTQDLQTLTGDIWTYELPGGPLQRRTFAGINQDPLWTPDGKRLIFRAPSLTVAGGGVSMVPADGSAAPSFILVSATLLFPTSISPDGKTLLGDYGLSGAGLWVLPLTEGSPAAAKPTNFLESKFSERGAQFSPDGHWVAYQSNESGSVQVYVVPYPGPGGKSQVSLDGGNSSRWNGNGRELFFRSGNKMMSVEVQTSPAFHAGTPKTLFETANAGGFEVSPDGRRFLMIKPGSAQPGGQQIEMRVVLNWFEELRRRVPLPK